MRWERWLTRWRKESEPRREGPAECFACAATPPQANGPLRVLCEAHAGETETVSGQSLQEVISQIESQLGGGPLEGAPLQWLFGGVTLDLSDGRSLRGWTLYVPAVLLIAEDRFQATSWLEFWISDLTLTEPDFGRPGLRELAHEAASLPGTASVMEWIADRRDVPAVRYAWGIWAAEELVKEKRDSTGQVWPSGDEVSSWLSPGWEVLAHVEAERFCDSLMDALGKRIERGQA